MRRILFFDSDIIQYSPSKKFDGLNVEIIEESCVNNAWEILKQKPISMVISEFDDGSGSCDGEWLLEKLNCLDPRPPFIFLSSGPSGPSKFFKLGAQCCFPKNSEGFKILYEFIELWKRRDIIYSSFIS